MIAPQAKAPPQTCDTPDGLVSEHAVMGIEGGAVDVEVVDVGVARPPIRREMARQGFLDRRIAGYTITEMVVVCVVLSILSLVVFPVAKFTARRQKEIELRKELRTMRNSIDEYKRFSDAGLIPLELGTEGYPVELEVLVEGVELVGTIDKKHKFLRRIPIDPMTGEAEWEMRSVQDDFDSTSWGGENVYDVYSSSSAIGLNGIPYSEW